MDIDTANLLNLTRLWKKYGAKTLNSQALNNTSVSQYFNPNWPYRCWFESNLNEISEVLPVNYLENINQSSVIPVWQSTLSHEGPEPFLCPPQLEEQLLDNQWHCTFEQTAMYMALQDMSPEVHRVRPNLKVSLVKTVTELQHWVDIGSEAFNYPIEPQVIEALIEDKDIKVLLAYLEGQAVACALLFKTGDLVGIHQVGVKQVCQGQGIARAFMHYILQNSQLWGAKYLVLQASELGLPLYQSIGFKQQFKIKNYQVKPNNGEERNGAE